MESEIKLAVLENEVRNVKEEIRGTKEVTMRIDQKMDMLAESFASKDDLREVNRRIDKEVIPEIKDIKGKRFVRENVILFGLFISILANVVMVILAIAGGKH